jgi:5-methyltetrahydrofolate--homocysteine methyltransferase
LLFDSAQQLLQTAIRDRWLVAKGIAGIFPANRVGDDVVLYTDPGRSENHATVHFLRQQRKKAATQPNFCLADFIAPVDCGCDWLGAFAVTTGLGIEEHVIRLERALDDFSALLLKSLADRLAEAFAEYLHELVRKELWGYAPAENLSGHDLVSERYRGIRPAPGYPACPDHTEKRTIWSLLNIAELIGIQLTENLAMYPAASVSGYYFAHPQSQYFGLGQILMDQLTDYARRKGVSVDQMRSWLQPNLVE